MSTNLSVNIFNPQRQYLFVQRQFSMFQNRWALAGAVVAGLLLIITIGTALFALEAPEPYGEVLLQKAREYYNPIFFFGGLLITSQIFTELHSPHKSYALLTLPASTLEKLIGSWLLTSPIYILIFTVISFIIYGLGFLIAGVSFSPAYFFTESYWDSIATYLVIQTIFLWGASYFRKNNFLKTALTIIGLLIAVGMFTGLMAFLMLNHLLLNFNSVNSQELGNAIEHIFLPAVKFLYWAVLGPYMLLMAYFTLKERQV